MSAPFRLSNRRGLRDLHEATGLHRIDITVDRNLARDERAPPDAFDVVDDALLLVLDREPIDILSLARSRAVAGVSPLCPVVRRRLEAPREEVAEDFPREELHAAVRVVNDEPFPRAQELVRDDQGPERVVARAASGVADDVGVALAQACDLGRIDARVHAGENGEPSRGGKRELSLVAEARGVRCVGGENFLEDLAHGHLLWRRCGDGGGECCPLCWTPSNVSPGRVVAPAPGIRPPSRAYLPGRGEGLRREIVSAILKP